MRTSNPALNDKVFQASFADGSITTTMTLSGTVMKTAVLLGLAVATASVSWMEVARGGSLSQAYLWGGAIAGLIAAIVTVWKPTVAPVSAPIYALCEGFFLGAISSLFEGMYQGIVIQAAMLTFGTLAVLLTAYSTGLIRATENFKLGVAAATGGIFIMYMATFVLSFFGITVPYVHESGLIGIGISLFIVVVAALNLVLDFDFIETGVDRGAPKYMEWYGAFGLMVTLVWLYVEFLRLLAKLNSRD